MVLSWWRRRLKRLSRPILTGHQSVPGARCVRPAVETLEDRVVPAGTFTWTGRVSGFWSDGRNWVDGSAPKANDRNDTLNFVPTSGFTNTTDNIPNLISPQIIVTGVYTLNQLPASATITVGNGGALTVGGTVGTTTVQKGGTLIPTPTPTAASLKVQGDLTLQSGSTFGVLIISAGNFGNAVVSGTVTLQKGCSLNLMPAPGQALSNILHPTLNEVHSLKSVTANELVLISSSTGKPVQGEFDQYPDAQLQPTPDGPGALYVSYNAPEAHANSVILHGPDDHILYVYALLHALQQTDPSGQDLTNSSGQVTDLGDLATIYNNYLSDTSANQPNPNAVNLARDTVARELVNTLAYRMVEARSFFDNLNLTPAPSGNASVAGVANQLVRFVDWSVYLSLLTSKYARENGFRSDSAFVTGLYKSVLGVPPRPRQRKAALAGVEQLGRYDFGKEFLGSPRIAFAGTAERVQQILGRPVTRGEKRYFFNQIRQKGLDADTLDVVLLAGSTGVIPSSPITFVKNGPPLSVTQPSPSNFGDELLTDYKMKFTPPSP